MDPSAKYSPAGRTVFSCWETYKKEKSSAHLDQVIASIKENIAAFGSADCELFQEIATTFKPTEVDPDNVNAIRTLAVGLIFGISDVDHLKESPSDIRNILSHYLSLKDLHQQLFVDKLRNEEAQNPLLLARLIEQADEMIPLTLLIDTLKKCGPLVQRLDLYKLLKKEITVDQLAQILKLCPRVQMLVVGNLTSDPTRFFTICELVVALEEHFAEEPARSSLTHFALISESLHWTGNFKGLEALQILKDQCPHLQELYVDCVLSDWSGTPLPHSLKPWLDKGGSIFDYYEVMKKIYKLSETPFQMELISRVPPDWFLALPPERKELMMEHTPQLLRISWAYLERLEEFAQLSEEAQDILLTHLSDESILEKAKGDLPLQEIVKKLLDA